MYNILLLLLLIIIVTIYIIALLFNIHIILLCRTRIVLLSIGYLSDIMRYYHVIETRLYKCTFIVYRYTVAVLN